MLKAELPDMTREDIDITVDKGTLTIKGEKKLTAGLKEDQFHRIERRYGTFSRSFSLPLVSSVLPPITPSTSKGLLAAAIGTACSFTREPPSSKLDW